MVYLRLKINLKLKYENNQRGNTIQFSEKIKMNTSDKEITEKCLTVDERYIIESIYTIIPSEHYGKNPHQNIDSIYKIL